MRNPKLILNLLILFVLLALCPSIQAQYSKSQGWAEQGGSAVTIGGITTTTKYQSSFPSCTVTVYDAGTSNLSTIYSDSVGTPKSNPFTSSATAYWFFFAASGSYDVQFSGTGISVPFTLGSVVVGSSGGGGGSPGGASGTLQYNNSGSLGGVTSSSVSGANITLGGKITLPTSGIILDMGIANLTDIIGIGTSAPQRIGLTVGTNGSPVSSRFPTIAALTYTQPASGGGNTTSPYFFGTIRKAGGAQGAIYNLMGYIASDDTNPTPTDAVGVVGFAAANLGSTSRAIGVYGEATIFNQNTFQGAYHELRVVNGSGIDSAIATASLPSGYTIGLQISAGGGNLNTIGLDFGGGGTSAFLTGIHFPGDVIASGGYGIDFKYSTRGTPIRFANNDSGLVARNALDSADRSLIKLNSSNQVLIANSGDVAIFGSSVRPGTGSFVSSTAQFYTTSTQGLVITAGAGSTYDFLLGARDGSTLATVITNTPDLQLGAGTGKVYLGGGALATNATNGFPAIPSSSGAPTGTLTLTTGYVAMEFDSTNNYLYTYSSGWKAYQPAFKGADVASASAIVPTGRTFHVTGTTNITSITSTGIVAGTVITIIFDGILTFTDGSNLKLAGNFTTSADDTITLQFDGSNWYEVARSAN